MQLTALIGTKKYQKQGFLQDGKRIPLTAVVVSGNVITQIKTADKEGYNSLQLGINSNKKARKSITNHSKKAGLENTPRFFKEIKAEDLEGAALGLQINVSEIFSPGDIVDVTGISKGKGWAGGVKRWGFHGGPRTHGQSDRERAPGSIGQTTTPGRVYRGKKMAGRMGSDTVTVKNLEVISVTDDGVLLIKGLVPGNVNGLVMVNKIGTNNKFVPLYKEPSSADSASEASTAKEAASDGQGPEEEKPAEEVQVQPVAGDAQKDNVSGQSQETQAEKTAQEPEVQTQSADESPVSENQEEKTKVKEVSSVAPSDAKALDGKKAMEDKQEDGK